MSFHADVLDLTGQVQLFAPRFPGNYSTIYDGMWKSIYVAVKVLTICSPSTKTMHRKITRERKVWANLHHPNITPLLGFIEPGEPGEPFGTFGALVSPFYENGDAEGFLQSKRGLLNFKDRLQLFRGVVAGLSYLHNRNPALIHGDLKPKNILIDNEGNPRLCDFGLARILSEEGCTGMTTTSEHTGTERYLAPELLLGKEEKPTLATDMYALGCVGLVFIFSTPPYAHRKLGHAGRLLFLDDIKAEIPPASQPENLDNAATTLWKIVDNCFSFDPNARPTAPRLMAVLECMDANGSVNSANCMAINHRELLDVAKNCRGSDDQYNDNYAYPSKFSYHSDTPTSTFHTWSAYPNSGAIHAFEPPPYTAYPFASFNAPIDTNFHSPVALWTAEITHSTTEDNRMSPFTLEQRSAAQVVFTYMELHPDNIIPADLITGFLTPNQYGKGCCLIGRCREIWGDRNQMRNRQDALDHIRDFHFQSRPFLCSKCTQRFSRSYDLDRHKKQSHKRDIPRCPYCQGIFTEQRFLDTHITTQHPQSDISAH